MGGGAQNPMAAMMGMDGNSFGFFENIGQQMMMNNPGQMENVMRLTEQLMGNGGGQAGQPAPSAAGAGNPTPASATPPPANPMAPNPFAPNPMAAMMQQMMGNPAQMQQGPGTNPTAAAQPANPMAANPFAAMMQQMQQGAGANPAAAAQQANPMAANPFAATMQQAQGQQDVAADLENNPMRQQVLR